MDQCPECNKHSDSRQKVSFVNKVTKEVISGYETFCKPECKEKYLSRQTQDNNWELIRAELKPELCEGCGHELGSDRIIVPADDMSPEIALCHNCAKKDEVYTSEGFANERCLCCGFKNCIKAID